VAANSAIVLLDRFVSNNTASREREVIDDESSLPSTLH